MVILGKGDTILTDDDRLGVVVKSVRYSEKQSDGGGSVCAVRFPQNPADARIFVFESHGYNFCLSDNLSIIQVNRGEKTIWRLAHET